MDNQTNYPQNEDNNSKDDRPLTSFLHAQQQAVRTEEKEDEDVRPSWSPAQPGQQADDSADSEVPQPHINNQTPSSDSQPQFGDILSGDDLAEQESVNERADEPVEEPVSEPPNLQIDIGMTDIEYISDADSEDGQSLTGEGETAEEKPDFDMNKLNVALKALHQMEEQIKTVINLLDGGSTEAARQELKSIGVDASADSSSAASDNPDFTPTPYEDIAALKPIDGRVVEGVFDGRGMVGSDGKNYLVPPNYASKSKLVEGDMLKLTITPKGSFIYKQIGPIERSRLIGTLGFDQTTGEYYATSENRRWSVLKASVTYFKGEASDEVVLLVPKSAPSKWAAVENVIKKNPLG